ncbi:DUF3558 domain-containing protein [Amycolatopsis suaedae]|uniref:DUF3558 domain-containing protein n=1 Tax=Amycolatopsis suaedae TaxID=2510978 RepID=A0A4Q7J4U0_9PSEU|nr:DUF3558 domain-containing protein [Amycolatopsis suaedae]RZQ62069.1 DUF3558 domain-containing protein [Amycolatopsis suaedae]
MRSAVIGTTVLAVVLVGCSSGGGGQVAGTPTPAPPTSSPPVSSPRDGELPPPQGEVSVPGAGAPSVSRPLEVGRYEQEPCSTLSAAQVEEYMGTGATSEATNLGGPGCEWHKPQTQLAITVKFLKIHDLGLTALYANRSQYQLFRELDPVASYPAVAWGLTDDSMTKGQCRVRVGISDRATMDFILKLSEKNVGKMDPCAGAREVAQAVITNIQGGN